MKEAVKVFNRRMHTFEEMFTMRQTPLASVINIEAPSSTSRRVSACVRNIFFVALVLFSWFAMVSSATGQNIQHTENKADQALKSGLSVDPSSLGMSITIPLGGYPGRAGLSLPINVTYSSKVWRLDYTGDWEGQQGIHTENAARFAEHSAAGWTSSLDVPRIEYTGKKQLYDYYGNGLCMTCSAQPPNWYYIKRIHIHMPDGSSHELRADDVPHATTSGNPQYDFSGVFYAVDGSGVRYDTGTNTLFMADGSRYLFDPTHYTVETREEQRASQYVDRHGNTLSYNANSRMWTDTLGRSLALPLPANPIRGDVSYSLPGIDGSTLNYTFRWLNHSEALSDPNQLLRYTGDVKCGPPNISVTPYLFHGDGIKSICSEEQPIDRVLLSEIELPNGQKYRFTYNIYGEIDKVYLPTGGYERYEYGQIAPLTDMGSPYLQTNRGVVNRWVSVDGVNETSHWHYEVPQNSSFYTVKTTNPDGTYSERVLYGGGSQTPFGFESAKVGSAFEERAYSAAGVMLRRKLTEWTVTTTTYNNPTYTVTRDPRPTKEVSFILDTGGNALSTTTTFQYDIDFNVISTSKYGFVAVNQTTAQTGASSAFIPQPTDKMRTDETIFLVNDTSIDTTTRQAYRNRNLIRLPSSSRVKNAAGTIISQAELRYDESAYPLLTYGTVTGWSDPGITVRGLATTSRMWLDTNNSWLESHVQYDQCGSPRKMWDARGNVSEVEYSSNYSYAYPTHTISADPDGAGPLIALTTDTVYDPTSGAVISTTDANNQITQFRYVDDQDMVDPLNRLRKVIRPDGGWTSYEYGDIIGNLYVLTQTQQDATHVSKAYQFFDAVGRAARSYMSEGGTSYLATDTQYDEMGRVLKVSNTYRTQGVGGAIDPSDLLWTTSHYDALGRVDVVTLVDGTTVQSLYQGIYTTTTDQAGKKRRQKVDALGRIVRVDEPNASGNLGTVDTPTQASFYEYDTPGNLVHLQQGTGTQLQHRYFKYDSLSRLTYERQVEQTAIFTATDSLTGNSQWTGKLVYDEAGASGENNNGMLTSQYDARNIRTQYSYDKLGRISQVSYSDGTPTVTNIYDRARTGYSNRGRLSEVQTAAVAAQGQMPAIPATAQSYDYDLMGRVKSQQQTVGERSYPLAYGYNTGGQLTSQTYPSGRMVNYSYDEAARLAGVTSGATTYATNFVYGPKGALASLSLGNGAAQTFDYNDRLQLTSLSLVKDSNTLQRYEYKYGRVDIDTGAVDETKNNGQIARIEGFIGTVKQWQQRFAYDSLGRLSQASESRGDTSQQSYLLNYDYDQFGNRYQPQASNQSALSYTPVEDSDISQNTNRFTFSQLSYDNAGNVTVDTKFRGRQYRYDANNRQKWTALADGTAEAVSVYDGAGQRVAIISHGTTSYLVYDAGGKLVAEYGQPASSTSGTQYVFSDQQGSTRVVLNQSGGVIARHDYQPFGEEIDSNVGMRQPGQGYGHSDGVRQKYAGMEQDEASGMSQTLWRKYDSRSGRWTSPDPYTASMTISDPQSFNRYNYVQNDPVNLTDPSGLMQRGSSGDAPSVDELFKWAQEFGHEAMGSDLRPPDCICDAPQQQGGGDDDDRYTEVVVVNVSASKVRDFQREFDPDQILGKLVSVNPLFCPTGLCPSSKPLSSYLPRSFGSRDFKVHLNIPGNPDGFQVSGTALGLASGNVILSRDGNIYAGWDVGLPIDIFKEGLASAESGEFSKGFGLGANGTFIKIMGRSNEEIRHDFFSGGSINITGGFGGAYGGISINQGDGKAALIYGAGTPGFNISYSYGKRIGRVPIEW
jgi:RHS repeat-associated protein